MGEHNEPGGIIKPQDTKTVSSQQSKKAEQRILESLQHIIEPGQVTELRALDVTRRGYTNPVISGYFDDMPTLAKEAAGLLHNAVGIYIIPNPVNPALLARAANRIREQRSGKLITTSDPDILCRRWLLIDVDADRPAGISSNDEEHGLSIAKAWEIREALAVEGWPDPIFADSGNGGHLMYRVDLPVKDEGLIQRCLEALAAGFDDDRVHIDQKVYNPARIWKLYGTAARKGDFTPERPHRWSNIFEAPAELVPVPVGLLEELAKRAAHRTNATTSTRYTSTGNFDLEDWIREHQLDVRPPKEKYGGRLWEFNQCPWNPDHCRGEAFILQHASGAPVAGCPHNSCKGKTWHDLRDLVEPGWREKRKQQKKEHPSKDAIVKQAIDVYESTNRDEKKAWSYVAEQAKKHGYTREDAQAMIDSLGFSLGDWSDECGFLNKYYPIPNKSEKRIVSGYDETPEKMQKRDREGQPVIYASCNDLETVTNACWEAIQSANQPPKYFLHAGIPCRLETEDDDRLVPKALTIDRLRYELARIAAWKNRKLVRDEWVETDAKPPLDTVRDILATPDPPLPILNRIIEVPSFAPDGKLETHPGYHASGKAYYIPAPDLIIPPVSPSPDIDEQKKAKNTIFDMIQDFPFLGDADRAHAVALMLLPFVRDMIDGPTPNHLIEAPCPGSGKGLLAEVLLFPGIGRHIAVTPQSEEDGETRKQLTTLLKEAHPAILFDNVTRAIDSGVLAAALTATVWRDRVMGVMESAGIPVRCTWVTTANNPTMSTEIARRSIRIRLDPMMDRPWMRDGFTHQDLRTYVTENRGILVWAVLTLAQAWIAAGKPKAAVGPLGTYERWTTVIGGICHHAGIPGFLRNLEEFYELADLEGAKWRQFVEIWWDAFGAKEVGTAQLFPKALESDLFDLGKGSSKSQRVTFGKLLSSQRDRVIGNHRITCVGTRQRAAVWVLSPAQNLFSVDETKDDNTALF